MISRVKQNGNGIAWTLLCAAMWLWTWRFLANEWRSNEQYQFGFAVPFLAVGLAWLRFHDPDIQNASAQSLPPSSLRLSRILAVIGLLLFTFGELVRQQDPMWRLAGWSMAFGSTLTQIAWILRWGGAVMVRHLAFPLAFSLLVLPWPSFIETPVTQKLLQLATALSVELLNWGDIAALSHGNVIELSQGVVGIDNACSGIQSFQASLMVTLFLGEYLQFLWKRRLLLLVLGWIIALLGNLGRIVALTVAVHHHGESAISQYHDRVGGISTAFIFISIGVLAWLLRPRAAVPASQFSAKDILRHWIIPGKDGYALLLLLAAVPWLTMAWFAVTPGGKTLVQSKPLWLVNTNLASLGWSVHLNDFTPEEKKLLRFSDGLAMDLKNSADVEASVVHLFWQPDVTVPFIAYSHSPDVCLRAAGWQMPSPPEPVTLQILGQTVQGSLYHFKVENSEQTVLQLVWQGGELLPFRGPAASVGNRSNRLAILWQGPRRRGHEIITVYMPDSKNARAQIQLFEQVLNQALTPAPRLAGR